MKFDKIGAILKKNKKIILYNDTQGGQWIGNGVGIYSMYGMPFLAPEVILRLFGVSESQMEKWEIEVEEMPVGIDFSYNVKGDVELEPFKTFIDYFGDTFMFLWGGGEICCINAKYTSPIAFNSSDREYTTFHRRKVDGGGYAVVVKCGLELSAVIMPLKHKEENEMIKDIVKLGKYFAKGAKE